MLCPADELALVDEGKVLTVRNAPRNFETYGKGVIAEAHHSWDPIVKILPAHLKHCPLWALLYELALH